MKFKHFLKELLPPWPYFYIEEDVRSDLHDMPEVRYYLWVIPGFGQFKLLGSATSREELKPVQEAWEAYYREKKGCT